MYTLLIADDEAIEREAIRYFIDQSSLEFEAVEEAANGIEAVAKALQLQPDIIIMDVKMPGKDGLEAAKEIRQFRPEARIIFLTAYNEFEFAHKAIKVKADDFIIKPAYSDNLLKVLFEVIEDLDRINHWKQHIFRHLQLNGQPAGNESDCNQAPPVSTSQELEADVVKNSHLTVLIDKVCDYIDHNFQKDLRLDEMCEMAGFSKYYFSRAFKQCKKMNLIDYITQRRIEKAKELLHNPRVSIKEVSSLVGYNDANYLTSVFKRWEGISPSIYRSKNCGEN